MELMIFSSSTPAPSATEAAPVKAKQGEQADSASFEEVMQQEDQKMTSEAEALMLALLQKSQPQPVVTPEQVQTAPNGEMAKAIQLAPENLVEAGIQAAMQAQAQAAADQGDDVGTSQFVDQIKTAQTEVVNISSNIDTAEAVEVSDNLKAAQAGISLKELDAEALQDDGLEIDPQMLKNAAESKQRVDQVTKTVVEPQTEAAGKTANTKVEQVTVQQETSDVQGAEQVNMEDGLEAKMQFEQVMKTTTTNEPARLAEAQPRQTIAQLSEKIEMMFQQGKTALRLQLAPEELGKIDIRLVNSGQGMRVSVLAEQAETGKLLEAQLDQLRQTLEDAGIQLSQLNVGQQNGEKRNAWLMQERFGRNGTSALPFGDEEVEEVSLQATRRSSENGVDYRV